MEKSYAKSLKSWSKKWGDLIEKGEESIDDAIAAYQKQLQRRLRQLCYQSVGARDGFDF